VFVGFSGLWFVCCLLYVVLGLGADYASVPLGADCGPGACKVVGV
jgi:hypothetical protein